MQSTIKWRRKMRRLRVALALAVAAFISFGCAGLGGAAGAKSAPEFKVELLTGEEVTLAKFAGKPLVLNIGASWCPHCLREMPAFREVYEDNKDGVAFLMVFVKSPRKEVDGLVKKQGLSFKVGYDEEAVIGKAYGVKGIPHTFFIGPDGKVVDDYIGSIDKDELAEKVSALLKGPKK